MTGIKKPKSADTFAPFRFPQFRLYFTLRFCFTLATQMQAVVIGFYVYQLTHSKIAIAFIGLSEVIPAIGIALYGGYIADKSEKRKMLLLIYAGLALTSMVLFSVTGPLQPAAAAHILALIYGMLFVSGFARAFYEPAAYTVYAHSVPRNVFAGAASWNNLCWQAASIIGPLAGGFIYAFANHALTGFNGAALSFAVVALLHFVSLLLVFRLKKLPPEPTEEEEDKWKNSSAGLRFVFSNKLMFYAMSLDLVSVLFGGVSALLPIYALDILKIGPAGLGIMRMALSLGAALTMIGLTRFSPMGKPWRNLLLAIAGFGCAIIGFGLSRSFALSLVFLFLQGGFDSISVMIRTTLMQYLTPDAMRGRVSAVNSMFISSSAEIGDFESGIAAKLLGTVPAVLFGGAVTLFIVGFTWVRTRELLGVATESIQGS